MADTHHATDSRRTRLTIAKWVILGVVTAAALYLAVAIYASGHVVVGSLWIGLYALAAYVYGSQQAHTYRYLFPGLAGIGIFVVFPLVFTIWIGFTEYSSSNIITYERARDVFLSVTFEREGYRHDLALHRDGDRYRLVLAPEGVELPDAGGGSIFDDPPADSGSIFDDPPADSGSIFDDPPAENADAGADSPADAGADSASADAGAHAATAAPPDRPTTVQVTPPLDLATLAAPGAADADDLTVEAVPLAGSGFTPGEPIAIREVIALEPALARLTVRLPDGTALVKSTLRAFAAEQPAYQPNPDGTLTDRRTGAVLTPNFETGYFETADGERVTPGFRVFVGLKHYRRLLTDERLLQPFFRIFVWTVLFAGLTVLFTLIVGVLLAELLQWEGLRFRGVYRVLLFLPYAVPGFISILVFKGLFNQNFGEINQLLGMLFGIRPAWFTDPLLAKVMILVVNTWLGYPYIMLLWMGLRQSVPRDLYEATALAGAGPSTNFFRITWPLVWRPLMPLLISSFAFNFNNFVLINLLTDGRPDFLDTSVPAGTTDILVSYTYRIAFQDTGKNFGLAAAISTVIFAMVAILSIINLRLTRTKAENGGK